MALPPSAKRAAVISEIGSRPVRNSGMLLPRDTTRPAITAMVQAARNI